jgi:hypothetical protein
MAKKFYWKKSADTIAFVSISDNINKADLQTELVTISNELGRPDEEKLLSLEAGQSIVTLDEYNDNITKESDRVSEILDYFDYNTTTFTADEITNLYMTPDAIVSFCAEDVGFEASKSIDDDNGTWWQDSTNHTHEIIYRIRDYPKRVIGFQIRRDNNDRSELTNLEARVANSLGGLNNDDNILVTGATLPTPADWNEIAATKKQTGEFIKLTYDSANADNEARIREIQVLTEPINNL